LHGSMEWRVLGDDKEELRKIIKPYASEVYPNVVHGLVTETHCMV